MEKNCFGCNFKCFASENLTEDEINRLSISHLSVKFKRGDPIIVQGMFSTNVAYLKSGLAKTHIAGPHHEQIVRIIKKSNYLGLPTTVGEKVNQYSVTAITNSEVCFIDISLFKKLLRTNSDFGNQILMEMCKNEIDAYHRCANKAQKQIRGRIADLLLLFADEIFTANSFPNLLSQEEIANMVDASRESVSRVLSEFAKDGIITMSSKQIEILNQKMMIAISANG